MIRIAIAEDITRIAETLKEKIELSSDMQVQFIAPNGKELIKQLQKNHNIDIILMDINMPEMNGIEATEIINQRWPQIKIIMSTVFDDGDHIFKAILAGATGYLMKDEPPAKVHRFIYEALEGGAPMSPEIARKALGLIKQNPMQQTNTDSKEEFDLTNREAEILTHLSKGLSYDQIADNLHISNGTVRKHIENIYRKLKVHNKVEALQKAAKHNLLGLFF